jgi:CBS domain-containing protein
MEKIGLTVGDVMVKAVLIVDASETVWKAAKFMSTKEIGCLVVMEGKQVGGMITERDLINRIIVDGRNPEETLVRDIMSVPPVVVMPEMSIEDAVRVMFTHKIKKLIVVEGEGKNRDLVDILTLTDIARVNPTLMNFLKALFKESNETLPRRFEKTIGYYIV